MTTYPLDDVLVAIEGLARVGLDELANDVQIGEAEKEAYNLGDALLAAFRQWTGINADLVEGEFPVTGGPLRRPAPPTTHIRMACSECGGTEVSRDATVRWSEADQTWELTAVHDGEYCDDCDGETRITENEIPA